MNAYEKNNFHDKTIHLLIIRDFKMICSSNIFSFLNLIETSSTIKQPEHIPFCKCYTSYYGLLLLFAILTESSQKIGYKFRTIEHDQII